LRLAVLWRARGRIYQYGFFIMAMALAAYVGTMAAALIALVIAWQNVIGPPALEKVHQQPHPVFAVMQPVAVPTQSDVVPALAQGAWGPSVVHTADADANETSADDAQLATAQAAAAEKAKRQKQARYQKRKEQLARAHQDQQQYQDQQYSTALGYAQERQASSAPPLNLLGTRRF
jgi:hypothetical protein